MKRYPSKGFTIIELLVVVSIIALLVGILLPAIGKARQGAMQTQSVSNIRQVGTTLSTYSSEYNDKHVTFVVDNLGAYGNSGAEAFANYATQTGSEHPKMWLGIDDGVLWYYVPPEETNVPFNFETRFGVFRLPNAMILADYMNGKFYDPVYYAPKDSAVIAAAEEDFDYPSSFPGFDTESVFYSSYCLSPAAMFNPAVFSKAGAQDVYFTDPYAMDGGFKAPTLGQVQYPDLKTWVCEHHWLQNRRFECNDHFGAGQGTYNGCEPYYFNQSILSNPVTLFMDMHTGTLGVQGAMDSSKRVVTQTGDAHHGLWSIDVYPGSSYEEYGGGGYYSAQGFDWSNTSFHILTIDGIRGRDVVSGVH
ncbi:MAG TPA: type II secretion system protein [Phycisphaerales bacterium]|nr:type II secretion system protein [Phycisphaerales bacterium]